MRQGWDRCKGLLWHRPAGWRTTCHHFLSFTVLDYWNEDGLRGISFIIWLLRENKVWMGLKLIGWGSNQFSCHIEIISVLSGLLSSFFNSKLVAFVSYFWKMYNSLILKVITWNTVWQGKMINMGKFYLLLIICKKDMFSVDEITWWLRPFFGLLLV